MLPDISHDRPDGSDLGVPVTSEHLAHRPVSESEVKREMERQAGQRR